MGTRLPLPLFTPVTVPASSLVFSSLTSGYDGDLLVFTTPYKHVEGLPAMIDVHLPRTLHRSNTSDKRLPAVVYFHGGGLTVGNRRSWFPSWLKERMSASGVIFISADYRLLPPSTGMELLEDIEDLFRFVSQDLDAKLAQYSAEFKYPSVRIDTTRIAVSGTSAGGLCAYLAALYASPRPVAMLDMYAMGGNFFTPHYLSVKTQPFFRGRELLDPNEFGDFIHPRSTILETILDSPLQYYPSDSPTPGFPANPRMQLARLYLQMGLYLDYYTGMHSPSLSHDLRQALGDPAKLEAILAERLCPGHLRLFPQLQTTLSWPPVMLVHGELDTAVPASESLHMRDMLQSLGVDVSVQIVPGQEHSFDYAPNAEQIFSPVFDQAALFLKKHLHV
ncbi:hypothetical protein EIP91_001119 [Steccherinum ochraceum]|uniref:Alpha/beta hydrolase fold-3 domain-containing protein n=1 Tax=Steccherinum ochraceum TaxID=92696 RepID=A0A4R0REH6_9APHY|nr:hypothetical protein EIP91_001119 [Steccherinum ochraceum]